MGRINFLQFKTFIVNLKTWQGVFKIYTKEKSGILRAERLRDALYDVGFQLSSDIMSILMLRYMRKDGTLRMGDFASAILHLTTAFGKFSFYKNWNVYLPRKMEFEFLFFWTIVMWHISNIKSIHIFYMWFYCCNSWFFSLVASFESNTSTLIYVVG